MDDIKTEAEVLMTLLLDGIPMEIKVVSVLENELTLHSRDDTTLLILQHAHGDSKYDFMLDRETGTYVISTINRTSVKLSDQYAEYVDKFVEAFIEDAKTAKVRSARSALRIFP